MNSLIMWKTVSPEERSLSLSVCLYAVSAGLHHASLINRKNMSLTSKTALCLFRAVCLSEDLISKETDYANCLHFFTWWKKWQSIVPVRPAAQVIISLSLLHVGMQVI